MYGEKIKSLKGVELLRNLRYLNYHSSRKKRIDISTLPDSNVHKLFFSHVDGYDLNVMNNCKSLRELRIEGCSGFSSTLLNKSRIERLTLIKDKSQNTGNFIELKKLETLVIALCRNMTNFHNDNKNIKSLDVQVCNKLNIDSISCFPSLKWLGIRECKQGFNLNFLKQIKPIENLVITNCKVSVNKRLLLSELKNLKTIWISPLKQTKLEKISQWNKKVVFANGKSCFQNGEKKELDFYYENR